MPDYDRPLNERGKRSAELLRRFLQKKNVRPELVLSSPSARTRETVELVFAGSTAAPDIRYEEALYLASAAKLLTVISSLEGDRDPLLLVGHNPGMEELSFRLTGVAERFPTCALARITVDIDSWADIRDNKGKLEWLVTPKQLEVS